MHTSYGNAIFLMDTPAETTRKVMNMYTDPTRIHPSDPGHVEGNPVFDYLDIFHPDKSEVEDLKARYREGRIGDVLVKQLLAKTLNDYLAPLRERRSKLIARPQELLDIVHAGTDQASPIAHTTIEEVYHKILNPGGKHV
jgi:tryptophanyl-tRNA synthetase